MISGLDNVSLFMDLDAESMEDISKFCTKFTLMDGEDLISENENASYDIYVLCDGNVEIITSGSGVTSQEISLSEQDKEIFGEISWLLNGKRTATIRCQGEVEAIHIDGAQFMRYLETHPQAGFLIMRRVSIILAQRLNKTNGLLKQILWNNYT